MNTTFIVRFNILMVSFFVSVLYSAESGLSQPGFLPSKEGRLRVFEQICDGTFQAAASQKKLDDQKKAAAGVVWIRENTEYTKQFIESCKSSAEGGKKSTQEDEKPTKQEKWKLDCVPFVPTMTPQEAVVSQEYYTYSSSYEEDLSSPEVSAPAEMNNSTCEESGYAAMTFYPEMRYAIHSPFSYSLPYPQPAYVRQTLPSGYYGNPLPPFPQPTYLRPFSVRPPLYFYPH